MAVAKRKSLSIKPARAAGLGLTLTARCRPPKDAGAVGTALIAAHYSPLQAALDHAGLAPAPARKAVPKQPYRDPVTMPIIESPESRLLREQLRWVTSLRATVGRGDKALRNAFDTNPNSRREPVYVVPRSPESCEIPQLSKSPADRRADQLIHVRLMQHAVDSAQARALGAIQPNEFAAFAAAMARACTD